MKKKWLQICGAFLAVLLGSNAFALSNYTVGQNVNTYNEKLQLEAEQGRTVTYSCPTNVSIISVVSLDQDQIGSGCSSQTGYYTCNGSSPNITMVVRRAYQGACSGGFYDYTDTDTYIVSTTLNACASKTNQASDPILIGMPYNAAYYQTVGVCQDNCIQKPSGPVILSQYANDGSGWTVGPWSYTGSPCVAGVTPAKPTQPSPADQCENMRNACEAKCEGRAYVFDCNTGSCQCFGAPGYTENQPETPTTKTNDPGSPAVPSAQTPVTDPGTGGNQLGAQIQNQGKQIAQGDAQLGQLGGINGKLGAVISNQKAQIDQGDKIIDYQRENLGATEQIRDTLKKWEHEAIPGLPTIPGDDTTIPNTKNWTEHDNPATVGADRANREIAKFGTMTPSPLNFNVTANGSAPALTGTMFGRQLEIRFDRPWMETGYSIMHALFIGIGYLQVFLMVHKVMTGGN